MITLPILSNPTQALLSAESLAAAKKRSRWDETPAGATPSAQMTPGAFTPNANSLTPSHGGSLYGDSTPVGGLGYTPGGQTPAGLKAMHLQTPLMHAAPFVPQTPEQIQAQRWEREIDERNRPLTDEELDAMFPSGYKVSGFLFLLFGGLKFFVSCTCHLACFFSIRPLYFFLNQNRSANII